MPANTELKVAGVWKTLTQPEIKVAGVWKGVDEIELKVAGVWKRVFVLARIGLDWDGVTGYSALAVKTGADAVATFNALADGTFTLVAVDGGTGAYDWETLAPASTGADYEAKWVRVSGINPTADNMPVSGTWYSLGTDRYLQITDTVSGGAAVEGVYDVTKRKVSDAATEVTNRITLNAEKDPS